MDFRISDRRIQAIQVFQQPDTRHAMDRRDPQCNPAALAIGKVEEPLRYRGIVQTFPLALIRPRPQLDARVIGQIVKLAQAVLRQQIVNHQASLATKRLLPRGKGFVGAGFSAMVTAGSRAAGNLIRRRKDRLHEC